MDIPPKLIGQWTGDVTDKKLAKPYPATIIVREENVQITSRMAQGEQTGHLTVHAASDGFLLLRKTTRNPAQKEV